MVSAASAESLDLMVRRGKGLMSRSGKIVEVVSGDDRYDVVPSARLSVLLSSCTSHL
jgi:hypothetical protein